MAGLYIHVPFCEKRCIYCDFYSNTDQSYKTPYLKALIREMSLRKDYLKGKSLKTLYFGGGTPSQLTYTELSSLFNAISQHYDLSKCDEITLEANPDDMTSEYIAMLRRLPINRISMGVQSFLDDDLAFLNRRHTSKQAVDAVHQCQDSGLTNLSIDLIYGLPGQTLQRWEQILDAAIALGVPHISAYHIIYEEGTRLWKMMHSGTVKPVDEETSVALFEMLTQKLSAAGFLHYEISNFAKAGFESRHNSSYWTGEKYLGLGPSAHSFDGECRDWNVASLPKYIKGIESGKPEMGHEELNATEQYNEAVFTGLRTLHGVNLSQLRMKFGDAMYLYCMEQAKPSIDAGLLIVDGDKMRLSHKAVFISDSIMSDLMKVD
jgi:putative oxygen-independent coproporphyrinogen III oxidase